MVNYSDRPAAPNHGGSPPRCPSSGCTGTVVGGFCNTCGMDPATPVPVSDQTTRSARLPSRQAFADGLDLTTATRLGAGAGGPRWSAADAAEGTNGTGHRGREATGSSTRDGSSSNGSSGSGTGPTAAGSRRRQRGARRHLTERRQLGLGLVQVPALPALDPTAALMVNPVVPEGKRACGRCEEKLRREEGFCPKCGLTYSFLPRLRPQEVVAGQYEVVGCLAYGGVGWIYLARDLVLSRWVVLKGLINTEDEAGAALAGAESRYLAALKHPNIVGIYNFVQKKTEGFIVMEYVGGKTLKHVRKERGPLPVAEAIAYVHRVLRAFAYLHEQEPPLIYCDFKPENCMLEGDDVKLIDLGGVRRVDDPGGDVYGTKGYSAPEASQAPSVTSDLYSVARTLAVLALDFRGFQTTHQHTLPTPEEQPLFAAHESLYRFLLKATRPDPDERFQSADEMAEQLFGVLREVVARGPAGKVRPADSAHFLGDASGRLAHQDERLENGGADLVPLLKLDAHDPAAEFLVANAGHPDPGELLRVYREAAERFPDSAEARLRAARLLDEVGEPARAEQALAAVAAEDPHDWRVTWYRGVLALRQGQAAVACEAFDGVYGELPGEPAAQLALALAAEAAGDHPRAGALYDAVSRTDPGYVSAVFGLGRCLARAGRTDAFVEAFNRVPPNSSFYAQAQVALARTYLRARPSLEEVRRAGRIVEALNLEGATRHRLHVELFETALELLRPARRTESAAAARNTLLGVPLQVAPVRAGLEKALRSLAKLADSHEEQHRLVDLANRQRPVTLF